MSSHLEYITLFKNISFSMNINFSRQLAYSIFGIVGGPCLGIFALGMLVPSATWKVSILSHKYLAG